MEQKYISQNIWQSPIEYLKGVGSQRAEVLKKELGIFVFSDLLFYFPFRYVDKTKFYSIKDLGPELPYVQLKGKIIRFEVLGKARAERLVAIFQDGTGEIELVWFQGIKWVKPLLKVGEEYVVFGKATVFNRSFNIAHPDLELVSEREKTIQSSLQAMYNSTEKLKTRGLDSKGISKLMKTLYITTQFNTSETLSEEVIQYFKLMSKKEALTHAHFPRDVQLLKTGQFRLKFEELFFIQLQLLKLKTDRNVQNKGKTFSIVGDNFNNFYKNHLPFEPTEAQKRVIKEIRKDVGSGKQMNRLLQGDVGSGKTFVALMTMLIALDNGCQVAMMAPTEILAQQHFNSISNLLNGMEINIERLTGSTKAKDKKRITEQLANNEIQILIGTHALIEDDVKFYNLGFVVIDEQHKFGVAQRSKLWFKNVVPPHILVMTATPIPRTLAMTLYGDLDVSIIDELPKGRKAIKTLYKKENDRFRVNHFLKEQLAQGRQVYIVYPLISESEKLDLKALEEGYELLIKEFPLAEYTISIVHGRMKPAVKDYEMQRFVQGFTNIMVATTVIEVGIDVPNASVMVIENAERFGLSQLHQLRGRVGRGAEQSYCILMTSFKMTADAKVRMETMVSTNDGFKISEVDLKLRGPGDITGLRQSGLLDLRIADLATDLQILQVARDKATDILAEDPLLIDEKNKILKKTLLDNTSGLTNWAKIS